MIWLTNVGRIAVAAIFFRFFCLPARAAGNHSLTLVMPGKSGMAEPVRRMTGRSGPQGPRQILRVYL